MNYDLDKTDGSPLLSIGTGDFNDDYGVAFFGRNFEDWGEYLNENFVKLLENFAKSSAPTLSLKGQLWYDTSADALKVYNGTDYVSIPLFETSATAPSAIEGKFWLDSTDSRLYVNNGTSFKAVTPGTIEFIGTQITGSGTMDPDTGNYQIELTSSVSSSSSFTNIAVSGQSDIVAETATDTLTFVAGSGIVLTTNPSTDTLTIAADSSTVVLLSGTQTISGNKTFSGSLTATGGFYLGGAKTLYADNSPSTNTGIRYSSGQWELTNDGSLWYPITTGTKAPNTASYVTLATDATLTQERVLTAGTGISITDAGAGSTVTVANTGVTSAVAGTGIGVSGATGAVTITNNGVTSFNGSTGAITNYAFGTVAVSGQSNVVADSGSDTLTLIAGTGITITTNASGDSLTITNTVTDTDLNTTYTLSSETNASGAALRLTGSDSSTDEVAIVAGSGITVTRTDASTITIATSGSSGITSAYTSISDGSNTASASGTDTIKFRGGTGVTTTVASNDATHGDNVLISVQDGSTSQKGLVQLSDSGSSTSTTLAATANLANTKLARSGGTLTGALTISDSTASSSTTTGALIVTGGVGVGGKITTTDLTVTNTISGTVTNGALTTGKLSQFASTTSAELAGVISDETGSGSLVFSASPTFTGTANFAAISTSGNITVGGNLTVNGTTTTVNSTTTTLDDPIITLGGDAAPSTDDNKDRGVEFRYHNGTLAKVGFFGYDDSTGRFTYIPDATNSSEVFSGTVGDAEFGTVYAKATSAQYADLAERYEADAFYEPGTVLVVGGAKEVTACSSYGAVNLAGVVSTRPAYLMNSSAGSDITHPAIALKGRVPCKVYGAVKKGQLLTTSTYTGHAEAVTDMPYPQSIVGIALEDNTDGAAVIEIMIK